MVRKKALPSQCGFHAVTGTTIWSSWTRKISPVLKVFSGNRFESVLHAAASVARHGFLALELAKPCTVRLDLPLDGLT